MRIIIKGQVTQGLVIKRFPWIHLENKDSDQSEEEFKTVGLYKARVKICEMLMPYIFHKAFHCLEFNIYFDPYGDWNPDTPFAVCKWRKAESVMTAKEFWELITLPYFRQEMFSSSPDE